MARIKKKDFIIEEENTDEQLVFRAYIRKNKDKTLRDWAILHKERENTNEKWQSNQLFSDESSKIDTTQKLIDAIQKVLETQHNKYIMQLKSNTDWHIIYHPKSKGMPEEMLEFQIWNRQTGQGYRFYLYKSEANNFREYLKQIG